MKILAVVVTYYPEEILLKKNIDSFVDYVDKVLIWENTPLDERERYRYIEHEKVEYCGDGINSISHGLNYAWNYAKRNCYDYMLSLDQDSVFEDFVEYRDAVVKRDGEEMGVYGLQTDRNKDAMPVFEKRPAIITSGMIISVNLLDVLSGYCEAFSVDGIDSELCLKAKRMGYPVYQYQGTLLKHQFGEKVIKKGENRTVLIRNYPAGRLYGIFRNHIILLRKYKNDKWIKQIVLYYFRVYFFEGLLYDSKRFRKMVAIARGIIDGFLYNIKKI